MDRAFCHTRGLWHNFGQKVVVPDNQQKTHQVNIHNKRYKSERLQE